MSENSRHLPNAPKEVCPALVREILDYRADTGVLTWKHRGIEWFKHEWSCKMWNARHAGSRAGAVRNNSSRGYINIKILGSDFAAHRLAWAWMTGEPPPAEIDHLDGDATNNKWINLRDGSDLKNARNKKRSSKNTSGITGVVWNNNVGKWQAQVGVKGKTLYLGIYNDIDEARKIVSGFREENGFTPRHGTEI